jgi:hypothetical protein
LWWINGNMEGFLRLPFGWHSPLTDWKPRSSVLVSLLFSWGLTSAVESCSDCRSCYEGCNGHFPEATEGLVPMSFRRSLLNPLIHAIVWIFHNFLNVLVETANKMGLQKSNGHLSKHNIMRYQAFL